MSKKARPLVNLADETGDCARSLNAVARRLRWLRIIVPLAYLCGMLMSRRLWFGLGRSFPRAPVVEGLPVRIVFHDYLLAMLLVCTLVICALLNYARAYLIAVVVLTALLVCLDQNRLQPWVYQYVILLALISFVPKANTARSINSVFLASQLVVATLYFWSGAQKLNWSFGHEVMKALLRSWNFQLPPSFVAAAGILVALGEISIAVGLMISRTRLLAIGLTLVVHLLVLVLLIGARQNSVVWPWNVAMIPIVGLLFWGVEETLLSFLREPHLKWQLPLAVTIICGLLPVLSFAGWWDLYLSGSLYSGRTPAAVLHIDKHTIDGLPDQARKVVFSTNGGEPILPFYEWSINELNVPPYPQVRAYRSVAAKLCELTEDKQNVELIVRETPGVIDGVFTVTRTSCAELVNTVGPTFRGRPSSP